MKPFSKIHALSSDDFKRTTGVSKKNFQYLIEVLKNHVDREKEKNPMRKRGLKGKLLPEEKLLLTLYYLRHYPTFMILGRFFEISESYACKIYHDISGRLLKIIRVSNCGELMESDLDAVIIDVCEQPVERPVKRQKDYYSGKKSGIPSKFN